MLMIDVDKAFGIPSRCLCGKRILILGALARVMGCPSQDNASDNDFLERTTRRKCRAKTSLKRVSNATEIRFPFLNA